jgi:uncharacterized membrane protein
VTEAPGDEQAQSESSESTQRGSHADWFAKRRAAADDEARAAGDPLLLSASGAPGQAAISSTGLSPHVASVLVYAAAWLSAIIFLTLERDSRLVRFHALQATYALGGLCALGVLFGMLTVLSAFYSTIAFKIFSVACESAFIAMAVVWLIALVCVLRNAGWKMPLVGRYALRRA